MAAGDISLAIMITAQNQASSVIQGLARDLGPLGVGMAAIGVGAIAAGVAAVKMAGDYQSATTTLVTGAGESVKNLGLVRQGLLDVSVATGTSTDALVKSMFLVESAGYHGAAGLQVETIAAEGAKVAHSDLTQTVDILTTSLHDYGMAASQAVPDMNSLIVSVKNGKMTMDNLNEAMIHVLPVASALHVPLADVEGALSTMAIAGDKGSIAGTHLAMMLKMLANPASTASKEMAKMGIDSIALAQTMETSLPDALIMIQDAVAQHFVPGSVEYNRAIATILGGSKSGIAGLELMGQNMNTLVADTNAAATALRNGGKDVQGWALVQDNFNQKLDQAHAAFDAMLIQLGTKLLPVLTPIAGGFANWATNMAKVIGHTDFSGLATAIQGISDKLGATFDLIGKIGNYTVNSQSWKDAAVAIGGASNQVGIFMSKVQQAIAQNDVLTAALKGTWDDMGSSAAQAAGPVQDFFTILNQLADNAAGKAESTKYAFLQLGEADNTILSVADAMNLLAQGVTMVTDSATGADINIAKFAKTADLSGSSTVTLAHALELVGKNASGFLTAADDAKLLAMNIGNVRDMSTGAVTDLKSEVNQTGVYMSLANQQMQQWYTAIKNGSTQTFSQFQADLQNKAEKELKITGATADDTYKKLMNLNAPIKTSVDKAGVTNAGQSAVDTYKKLLAINGPYKPIVDVSSILNASAAANGAYWNLQRLNGSSVWTSYINTVSAGAPVIGHGFASGVTNNPTGQWAMVGERGPEYMYVPQGANILPHGINPASKGAFGLSGASSANDKTMNITVQLDSRNMMQALGVRQAREIRIQGNYRNG